MTSTPTITLPEGMEAVTQPDGSILVRPIPDQELTKTLSFRTSTSEYNRLRPFFETFEKASTAAAFRWLLAESRVRAVVTERVAAAETVAT